MIPLVLTVIAVAFKKFLSRAWIPRHVTCDVTNRTHVTNEVVNLYEVPCHELFQIVHINVSLCQLTF